MCRSGKTHWIKCRVDDRHSGEEDEGRVVASGSRKVDLGFEHLRVESLRKGNNMAGMEHVVPKHCFCRVSYFLLLNKIGHSKISEQMQVALMVPG